MAAYSKWRILITKVVGRASGSVGYSAVGELKAFADSDASGPNLFVGGTASASEDNGSTYVAANAFDGSESTDWESTSAALASKWLRYDLPAAVSVKAISLRHLNWPDEVPDNFDIQASNDGTSWSTIAQIRGFVSRTTAQGGTVAFALMVGGNSKLDTGQPAVRVLLSRWSDGVLLATAFPDLNGNWEFRPTIREDMLITHIGPAGYRPISDGPVTPYEEP